MGTPAVSVVIPIYNGARFLEETLESVLAQSMSDFELLLIDDGSTDGTRDMLARHPIRLDPRVRVVFNGENLGLPATMNKAMGLVQAPYLARSDHDDKMRPDRLALQLEYMDTHPHVTVLGGQFEAFGDAVGRTHIPAQDDIIKANLVLATDSFVCPSTLWRMDFVRAHQARFDASLFAVDDYAFWVHLMTLGATFANLPDVLLDYRVHAASASYTNARRLDSDRLRVFQRVLRLFFPTLRTVDITRMMDLDWAVRNADRHDLAALCAICHRAAITQSSVHGQSKACVARHLMHMLDRIPARLGDETGALAQTIEDWRRGNPDAVDCVMQLI